MKPEDKLNLEEQDQYVGQLFNALQGFRYFNKGSSEYLRAIKDVENLCWALKRDIGQRLERRQEKTND